MKIDVEHVAKLARLGITEQEKILFEKQLSDILDYANILNKLDTNKVVPTSHAIAMKNVFREDKAIPCQNTKEILKNAPDRAENTFRVPRIIE